MGISAKVKPFVSYAREDAEFARRLVADLVSLGAEPWLDIHMLLGGQAWKDEIAKALRRATHVLAIISASSVSKRGYVQRELKQALEVLGECPPDEVFLIPVRVDDSVPRQERLRELNWVDFFPDYDAGLQKLAISLGLGSKSKPRHVMKKSITGDADILEAPLPLTEPEISRTENVNVIECVREAVNGTASFAASQQTHVELRLAATRPVVRATHSGLRTAVTLLLQNAIINSLPADPAAPDLTRWVGVTITENDKTATIAVENWGIPTTVEEMSEELIFQRGYVSWFARQIGLAGRGISLFLIKVFVERFAGSVMLDTEPARRGGAVEGRTSTIRVTLPLARPRSA